MSRRHRAEKREINPDPKFGDLVVTKFMNAIMLDGKKSVAETIVYGAFDVVQGKAKADPLGVFHSALDNVAPHVEVRSRRVGGATYQVPVDVRPERRQALAIRWLIAAARKLSLIHIQMCIRDRSTSAPPDPTGTAVGRRPAYTRHLPPDPCRCATPGTSERASAAG